MTVRLEPLSLRHASGLVRVRDGAPVGCTAYCHPPGHRQHRRALRGVLRGWSPSWAPGEARYEAKRAGGGCWRLYEDTEQAAVLSL